VYGKFPLPSSPQLSAAAQFHPALKLSKSSFVLIYRIMDRTQFAGTEAERRIQLLQTVRRAAGVDSIQLREKDLCVRDLDPPARDVLLLSRAIRLIQHCPNLPALLRSLRSL
jgi:hypothetical protein